MTDYVWKALLAEFVGTFTLVFVGASTVALTVQQGGSLVASALAFGFALLAIVYIWGSYSGAHVNPAVSFGFAVAGRMHWGLMIGYWIAQLLGGIVAAALVAYFFGTATGVGASVGSLTNTDAWKAVLMEAFLTFFLVLAFLFVTRNPMLAIVSGLILGLTLAFAIFAGSALTGASTNPARSLGPALFSHNMGTYWIYIVGPLLGALVAALVYKLFTVDFSCSDKLDECGKPMFDKCGNRLKECCRPVLDKCGNPVTDCNGVVYESYTTRAKPLNHMQETPLHAVAEWMTDHSIDPRFVQQELSRGESDTLNKSVAMSAMETESVVAEVDVSEVNVEVEKTTIDAVVVTTNTETMPLMEETKVFASVPVSRSTVYLPKVSNNVAMNTMASPSGQAFEASSQSFPTGFQVPSLMPSRVM